MNEGDESYRGSRAARPDLDWSQIRETVLMLELAAGQIMAAMRDSDSSVNALAESFTGMAARVRTIVDVAQTLPEGGETGAARQTLSTVADQVGTMANQAVVAFQFYDKLVQRLSHVVGGLSELSEIVQDPRRLFVPAEWLAVHERIHAKFTTEEERALCTAVLGGMPVQQALEVYLANLQKSADEIELF